KPSPPTSRSSRSRASARWGARLVAAQRHYRVEPGGAARRGPCGQDRRRDQEEGRTGEAHEVGWADLEEQASDRSRGGVAGRGAQEEPTRAEPPHAPPHEGGAPAGPCAERHPDADLLRAPHDPVAQHAVETDAGQEKGHDPKKPESTARSCSRSIFSSTTV